MPRLRRWDWNVSGGVIDCILVGLYLVAFGVIGVFWVFMGIGRLLTPTACDGH